MRDCRTKSSVDEKDFTFHSSTCASWGAQLDLRRNQMATIDIIYFMDVQTTSSLGHGILTLKSMTRKPGIGKNWGLPEAGRPFLSCLSEGA